MCRLETKYTEGAIGSCGPGSPPDDCFVVASVILSQLCPCRAVHIPELCRSQSVVDPLYKDASQCGSQLPEQQCHH